MDYSIVAKKILEKLGGESNVNSVMHCMTRLRFTLKDESIVNAQLNSTNMDETMDLTKMIQNILNIVKFHYKLELDEYSLHYERFITHLKFFSQRIYSGSEYTDEDKNLCEIMRVKYKEAYECAEKIKKYIKSEFNTELTDEEMMYLAVHINRVTKQTE